MQDPQCGISSIFPITVIAAIVLFTIKELVELFKRKSERSRKIDAYKILMSEELKKNAWTIKSLREMCNEVGREGFQGMSYFKSSEGTESIQFRFDDDAVSSSVLWGVHTSVFDKVVVDLAVVDKELFESAKTTYEYLAEVKHIRNHFVLFSEDETIKGFVKGLTSYGLGNLDMAFAEVQRLYTDCTGAVMSDHKLRSYI